MMCFLFASFEFFCSQFGVFTTQEEVNKAIISDSPDIFGTRMPV